MISEEEIEAQCPYCFSPITFVCERFSGAQSYVEDCEVCCKPIQIGYEIDSEGEIVGFVVERLDN